MSKVLIIAEAGVNHNGSIELAKKLIDVAADAGANYVKFQTFKAENLVSKKAKKAEYQIININDGDNSQFSMLKKLELSEDKHIELQQYCKKKNIGFLSTGFDIESIELLESLKIPLYKIPSGEITNKPYLQYIAKKQKPVILSTGMSNMREIKQAVSVLTKQGLKKRQITILHCNTEYPTPFEDVNLKAMLTIKNELKVAVGYSDHTVGVEVPIAAVALGAVVIEKHFTLDRNMDGPDHKASLEPNELKEMIIAIRNIEKAIGSSIKKPSKSERKNIIIARKSIVAKNLIKKGELLTVNNLTVKRPGNGITPMKWDSVLGTKAKQDFLPDQLIKI